LTLANSTVATMNNQRICDKFISYMSASAATFLKS
jgi:hypothetical protein